MEKQELIDEIIKVTKELNSFTANADKVGKIGEKYLSRYNSNQSYPGDFKEYYERITGIMRKEISNLSAKLGSLVLKEELESKQEEEDPHNWLGKN